MTHEFQNIKNQFFNQIEKAFVTVLDNHIHLKKKQLRFNNNPFMTIALRALDSKTYTTKSELITIRTNIKTKKFLR